MASYEERFYLRDANAAQRLIRNLKLLWWIVCSAWAYVWPGIMLRRAYRRAERDGKPLSLEDQLGGTS